jgi:hypothetical protein
VRACLLGHGDGDGGWGWRDADRNPSLGVGRVTEEELKTLGWALGCWLYHYFPFYFD